MREITFQRIFDSPTASMANLGEQAQTPDGRVWRYIKANEALGQATALTRTANSNQDTLASSNDADGNRTVVTQAGASFTVGDFDNSYLLIDSGTGAGQFAKIRTNNVTELQLFVDYALGTALSVSDSDGVIVRPHLAELTAITTLHQIPVGVAQIAFASADFGWALERGPGSVLAGANLVANELTTPGDDTEGTVITITNGETPDDVSTYGRCLVANDTADVGAMIDVNLM